MKTVVLPVVFVLWATSVVWLIIRGAPPAAAIERPEFEHRVDYVLELAVEIQALGREKGSERLMELAKSEKGGYNVFALCRMLFTSKPDSVFRRPALGQPLFVGESSDWPLEPVEIVDGVPFLVALGYSLNGKAERPEQYVQYCIDECEWSRVVYTPKRNVEKQRALNKLLSSNKWQRPLDDHERSFLETQIE